MCVWHGVGRGYILPCMAHVHVFWVRSIGLKLSCDLWAMVYSAWPIVCGLYRYGLWAIGCMGLDYGLWAMGYE